MHKMLDLIGNILSKPPTFSGIARRQRPYGFQRRNFDEISEYDDYIFRLLSTEPSERL